MSNHHILLTKECQNCGKTVEERYCSHCGQENTKTRQPFGHLFKHFVQDLTHYDGQFWKTMKYLLFRPAFLTKAYLEGKRVSYVPPVKLYIFITFVAFLLPAILPDFSKSSEHANEQSDINEAKKKQSKPFRTGVFIVDLPQVGFGEYTYERPNDYTSPEQMDSMQLLLPLSERYNWLEHKFAERTLKLYQKYSEQEVNEKISASFEHSLSKALFVYMPIFALLLWLLHGKRRWMYFDHAIFTLHNVSFILIIICLLNIVDSILSYFDYSPFIDTLTNALYLAIPAAMFYYLFRAHRKMYGESWVISTLKSFLLLILNIFFILMILLIFINISFFNLH